ncbi:MAG: DUF2807 domain-containing protein [Geminicoccaceae bacterium]|nr:DUF2807 domain-containing protein [Geminicoccaceae bacterium]
MVAALGVALVAPVATAETLERQDIAARHLFIQGFAGLLTIASADVETIDLVFVAHPDVLRSGGVDLAGDAVGLGFEAPAQSVVQQDGSFEPRLRLAADGRSIKVADRSEPGPHDPAELFVIVPVATAVQLERIIGEARVGALDGDIVVHLMSGDVTIERAGGGSLFVDGAGTIQAGSMSGAVSLTLAGSGAITLERGELFQLRVMLQGSGEIIFGGSAERAEVTAAGAGLVRLGPVGDLRAEGVEPGVVLEVEGR